MEGSDNCKRAVVMKRYDLSLILDDIKGQRFLLRRGDKGDQLGNKFIILKGQQQRVVIQVF